MTFKFDEEPDLGKVVKDVKPFCMLTRDMPVPPEKYIIGDYLNIRQFPGLAGRKWSKLCGFTFTSNDNRRF